MNKRYKLLLKKLLLCSLLAGSSLTMCRLQARGAINAQDSLEKQLDHAIDHGKLAEIKNILTEQPELINTRALGIHRETPLIRAVSQPAPKTQSDKDIFDYLLNFNNININMLDINGFSALDLALISFVDENRSEISRHMCKELMKKGAQVNKNYEEKALEEIKEEVRLESQSPAAQAAPGIDAVQEEAVITEQLEKQKAELAQLEQEQSKEEKELVKTEAKLEEVKILPIEPIAPIKKKVAKHKQKIAQKNDAIAVCKREIYLLEQAKLKAARRAAAQEAAAQPKKRATVQDFYGVKKAPKRKSRIRGGRAARRGPARKKSSKHRTAGKKSNKRNAKRKHSIKRKSAKRKQTQQAAE